MSDSAQLIRRDAILILCAAPMGLVPATLTKAMQMIDGRTPRLTPEEGRARLEAAFPFPRARVSGAQALREWSARRIASPYEWPAVVGDDEGFERITDQFSIGDPNILGGPPLAISVRSTAEILSLASTLRFPESLLNWEGGFAPEDLAAPVGDWPPEAPQVPPYGLTVVLDMSTAQLHPTVNLVTIPTANGWEVPAYFRWGGWNACPPPEYHVAALRHWHERYGAELIGIDGDTMNVRVARRPASREEALTLAREQYQYCPDIVDQGTETLSALAATLMASDWWFFWWD